MDKTVRTGREGQLVSTLGAFTVLAACIAPSALPAQVSLRLAAGARQSSTLVRDSIVAPIAVRPALGPAVALTFDVPLEHGWTLEALADLSWAMLRRHEGGTAADLGNVRTLAVGLALRHPLAGRLAGRIGVGGVTYLPAERAGVFRSGAGTLSASGGLGLRYDPDVPLARQHAIAVEARYDVHRFMTPALSSTGFTSSRLVHRAAVLFSARLLGRRGDQ